MSNQNEFLSLVPVPCSLVFSVQRDYLPRGNKGAVVDGKRFCDLGACSIEPENELILQMIENKLNELKQRRILLDQDGFTTMKDDTLAVYEEKRDQGILLDVRAIQLALTDIQRMIVIRLLPDLHSEHVVRVHTSYGLKHQLERYREKKRTNPYRGYIKNGDFIMAMLLLGFQFTRDRNNPKNAKFKCASLMERVRFNPGTRKEYICYMKDEFDDTNQ